MRRRMRFSGFSAVDLAPNDPAAFDKPVDLICAAAGFGADACHNGGEARLARVEYVLAQRTWRLQRALPSALDHPRARQNRVPLRGALLQQIGDERSDPPRVCRVIDTTGLRHRELMTDRFIGKQATIDGTQGDRVNIVAILLEQQIWVREQLDLAAFDPACVRCVAS
jgi:hypothetical protein